MVIWYGLSRKKQEMQTEVAKLKEAIAAEKAIKTAAAPAHARASTPVVSAQVETASLSTEERIARLEAKLASLEAHHQSMNDSSSTSTPAGSASSNTETEPAKARPSGLDLYSAAMSGVKKRIYETYQTDVLEAFQRLKDDQKESSKETKRQDGKGK